MSDGFWRALFLVGAIFNWIVGASLAFDTNGMAAAMGLEVVAYHPFYSPVAGWFVVVFGLLYFFVSRDLDNRAIALGGLIGKLGVSFIVWAAWWRGLVPGSMAGLVAIDFVFALLFAWFLATRRA